MTGAYVLGAFCSLTGPLGTPSSPHMPVRGRECGGVQGGYRRLCGNPKHERLGETPLGTQVAPGTCIALGSSLIQTRSHCSVPLLMGAGVWPQ